MKSNQQAKISFLRWMRARNPGLYNRAVGYVTGTNLGNTSAATTADVAPSLIDRVIDALEKLVPVYAGIEQNKAVIEVNIQRAKLGLPPIDTTALSPQVNVGVSREIQTILWAGLGALVVGGLIFSRRR